MKIAIGVIIGLAIALGFWFVFGDRPATAPEDAGTVEVVPTEETAPTTDETETEPEATEEPAVPKNVIGQSVEGRDITYRTFGTGEKQVLLVGGIHGGYEWNTVELAEDFITYYEENPKAIPENITITIVPLMNPDGFYAVGGTETDGDLALADTSVDTKPGRFNANDVDLNRNFDCQWQPESTWQHRTVSAGTEAFSEPEAAAFRDFVLDLKPEATVFWHSASNGIYSSFCGGEPLANTVTFGETYAQASGYPWYETFDHYVITGDVADWMSTVGLPAFAVELKTHETIEWDENKKGVDAMLNAVSNSTIVIE